MEMDVQATPATVSADEFAKRRLELLRQAGVDTSSVKAGPNAPAAKQWREMSDVLMPDLRERARAAGYSHVLDWLKAGADAKGQLPKPGARTEGVYVSPTEQAQKELQALKASGVTEAIATQKLQAQAKGYAAGQLASYHKVAAKIGDKEFTSLLADEKADPIALYAKASRRFSELADKAGYSDPRAYLHALLGSSPDQRGKPSPETTSVNAGNSPAHTGVS